MRKAIIGLGLVIFSATTQADMMLGYALGQAAAQSNTTKIVNGVPNDGFVRLWKSQAKQIGLSITLALSGQVTKCHHSMPKRPILVPHFVVT